MQSTQQQYAEVAYNAISRESQNADKEQYGQLCHRFPSLVLTNGLRLAVTFFEAKGKENKDSPYIRYLNDLEKAIKLDSWKQALEAQNSDYLYRSRQVLSASVWFKRYAEAILKVDQAMDKEAGVGD